MSTPNGKTITIAPLSDSASPAIHVHPEEIKRIWDSHCKSGLSPKFGSKVRCSNESNKIYLFDETRKDFESARNYCHQQFSALPYGELVAIEDCDEFVFIRKMLMEIREQNANLMTSSEPMTIWTSGYESAEFENENGTIKDAVNRKWLTTEGTEYVNLDDLCTNSSTSTASSGSPGSEATPEVSDRPTSTSTTSSESGAKILTVNFEKDKAGDYIFTTE